MMGCACFSPKLDMYDTFSGRQRKQASRNKSAAKNIKDLKSLIGNPKDFIHHDHLGLDDAQKLTGRPSHSIEPTSYQSSPVFSCMVVSTPTSPTGANYPTVEHPVFPAPEDNRHKGSVEISSEAPMNRIRRKSVPYYSLDFQSELQTFERSLPEATEIPLAAASERDVGSREPLDGKGRPLHRIGGEYMTQTTKFKWDKQMSEIASALKEGADEPESIRGLEPS